MATINKYILVDRDGTEGDAYYDGYHEAEAEAARTDCAVLAHIYEYNDSELVYTPDGSERWPPSPDKDASEWHM